MLLFKSQLRSDGETLAIARFSSEEALEAWWNHPEQVAAQRRGHEEFYESYWIQVCRTVRDYGWSRAEGCPHRPLGRRAAVE